ncbi:hypothetical protein LOZ53_000375 [Ophidiomyces ophidiicola]|nr:hypothetical protein LOZ55_002163 [Ophidiomyces ophidiicola]KAI1992206.1 hypothetical protein LOZ54_001822 [Ophidiomyces ophidiicola]KAI1993530.1 hypothetical protein LOZ51_003909 [Ophidiomyces ophidiicola]KAI1997557.1 hypothetical protein LOZ53_000375 [Ophidiomyces ophidiicola]
MQFLIVLSLLAASTVSAQSKAWEKVSATFNNFFNPGFNEWQKELDRLSVSNKPLPLSQLAAWIDIVGSGHIELASALEDPQPLPPKDIKGMCDNFPRLMDLTAEKSRATGAFGMIVKTIGQDKFIGDGQMRHALQYFQGGFKKTVDGLNKHKIDCSGTLPPKIKAAEKELKEAILEWQK